MIREAVDRVAEQYATGGYQDEVVRARREYRDLTGRVLADGVEGDELERELQTFLEWYVVERPLDGQPPIMRFLERDASALLPKERLVFRGLALSHRSVFEVDGIPPGEVHMRDLILGGAWRVDERRELVGMRRGTVLEARLVPVEGRMLFSESFVVHPPAVRHVIPVLIERLKERGLAHEAILAELGKRWLRAQHYRNVALERIYLGD